MGMHHFLKDRYYTDGSARSIRKYQSRLQYWLHVAMEETFLKGGMNALTKMTVAGRGNLKQLPRRGAFIIMSNHQSLYDAPLIIAAMPRALGARVAVGAATDNFFRSWLQSKPTRLLLNTYPIDRDSSGRHKGLSERLVDGNTPILVFPEGTRSRTGQLGEFHCGLARISLKNHTPILPVVVKTYDAWPADRRHPHWNRPRVAVTFLPPIHPDGSDSPEELTTKVKNAIAKSLRLADW